MIPLPPGATPRAWQIEAWAALREGVARWDSVLLEAATGTGKGTLIAGLCAAISARCRVLFLVHRDELLQDVAGRLRLLGVEPGLVGGGARDLDRRVTLAGVASCKPKMLAALLEHGRVPYVITDEAHHATASTYRRVYTALRKTGTVKHIGLTATPFRAGAEGATSGLGGVFDALVYRYPLDRAIADGVLVPVEGLRVTTSATVAHLDDEAALEAEINVEARNRLILDKYQEHGQGKPALGFALSIAHAKALAEVFAASGIAAAAVWGDDPERAAKLTAYRAGELQVLFCRDLLTEGVDLPRVEVLLMARPTASPVLYAQMIGRGTRLAPGKSRCLALDFVDILEAGAVQTLPNLLDAGEAAAKAPELKPGTRVFHRHDPGRADGNLVRIIEGGAVRLADVAWVGWGALDRVPLGDLARLRLELDGAAVEEVQVAPAVGAVAEFRVALFGGSTLPWYRYSGTRGDVRYTVALERRLGVVQLVREAAGRWSVWRAGKDVAHLGDGSLADMVAVAAGWLDQVGLQPFDWSTPWARESITPAQEKGLRKWGVQRPLASLCRGEASILLDTKIAKARIDAVRKRTERRAA